MNSTENELATTAQLIPMPLIELKDNVREIDKKGIKELASSIRECGLLQPVILRSVNSHYELVAGRRRFMAYTEVHGEEASIPAIVMDIDEKDVTAVQITENIQREGMSPFEESDAFAAIRDRLGSSIKDIAVMVGKSPAYVAGRLCLQHLDKSLRKLVLTEKISLVVALELAKYTPAVQKEVYNQFEHNGYLHKSVKEITEFVDGRFLRMLSKSVFPKDCPVGVHGPCTECPKRSSQEGLLFSKDMVKEDRCLDRECFQYKTKCQIEKVYNDTLTLHKDKCYAVGYLGHGQEVAEDAKYGRVYNSVLFTSFENLSKDTQEKYKDSKAYAVVVDPGSENAGRVFEVVRKKLVEVKAPSGKPAVSADERYFRRIDLNVKFPMFKEVFIQAVRRMRELMPYKVTFYTPSTILQKMAIETYMSFKVQALADILYPDMESQTSYGRVGMLREEIDQAVTGGDDHALINFIALMALCNDLRLSDKEMLYRDAKESLGEIEKVIDISDIRAEAEKKYLPVGTDLLEKFRKRNERNPIPPAKKEAPKPDFTSEEEEDGDLGTIGEDFEDSPEE